MTTSNEPAPDAGRDRSWAGRILEAPGRVLDVVVAWPPRAVLGIHLLAFLALAAPGLCRESCTFDEGMHLVAGYAGLTRGDFRLSPDNPPLGRMLSALPLTVQSVQLPSDSSLWRDPAPWDLGFLFLYQSGNSANAMLLSGRLPVVLWSLLLLAMVYGEARRMAGPRGGALALAVATFSPTLLAHGHLCTTDVLSTALIFAAVVCFRRFLQEGRVRWAAAAGLISGAALATKFSALCLAPVFGILAASDAAARFASRRSPSSGAVRPKVLPQACGALLLGALAYGSIWAAYGFRFQASGDPNFSFNWAAVADPAGVLDRLADAALHRRLLPESFLYGFKLMQSNTAHGHPTYALGMHATAGWKWYLPLSFLAKTPVSSLILMGWGVWSGVDACRRRRSDGGKSDASALIVPVVYGVLAVGKNMTIGLRHLLPMLPFLAVQTAAVDPAGGPRKPLGKWAPALLAIAILETIGGAPHFVGYFNAASRAIARPHDLFVDSNLDWGQDLAGLKRYMDREGIPEIKLSYFGPASPRHLGLRHEVLPGFNLYTRFEGEWKTCRSFEPGDVVAVSASNLVGFLQEDRNYYLRRFGDRTPDACIGGSILVYRMPPKSGIAVLLDPDDVPLIEPPVPAFTGAQVRTAVVGGSGGVEFAAALEPPAPLVGFKYSVARFESTPAVIKSLAPIFLRDGRRIEGATYGSPGGIVQEISAKPGFAVAGLAVRGAARVDGFKVIFMRRSGASLDPRTACESPWIGGRGGGPAVSLGGDGSPVVGLVGRSAADLDALGLLLLKP